MTAAAAPAAPSDAPLRARLERALAARGGDYRPRTAHLLPDGAPKYINRLILEESPYLLQHAHNPVDWRAWGAEAFAQARRLNRPIFLSSGYAACHWCHVMERESFEEESIAALLNDHFVPIKLDREQRPAVDGLYMTATLLIAGSGGWPLSAFLTPQGALFYGGTYFPPQPFARLLRGVAEAWRERPDAVRAEAERITAAVRATMAVQRRAERIDAAAARRAVAQLSAAHDALLGGFGAAPKFPHEAQNLLFVELLQRGDAAIDRDAALRVVERNLGAMAEGGLHDQVGGGFHRYAVDPEWRTPHFEKMLYNQAQMARLYLAAWRLTGKTAYRRVACRTLDFVLRDMAAPEGGFYAATDADSEGEEGRFFYWTPAQIRAALPPADAALAIDLYGVAESNDLNGGNTLRLDESLAASARRMGTTEAALTARLDDLNDRLYRVREGRVHPLRDEKILTEWNAMMVVALAEAGDLLGERRYLQAAERAADALWRLNRTSGDKENEGNERDEGNEGDAAGREAGDQLLRSRLHGRASVAAAQEDYACFAEALVALYDATGAERWLTRARRIVDAMLARFWDERDGGFFRSAEEEGVPLIVRPREGADGALPSGNSVALNALTLLAARTGEALYRERAEALLAAFAAALEAHPADYGYMLIGLLRLREGETGARRYLAGGAVAAHARIDGAAGGRRLRIELRMRPGWRINSHRPLQPGLIPAAATLVDGADGAGGWQFGAVTYPQGETIRLEGQADALSVYRGAVRLEAQATRRVDAAQTTAQTTGQAADTAMRGAATLAVRIDLQACDDRRCLAPEQTTLRIPIWPAEGTP